MTWITELQDVVEKLKTGEDITKDQLYIDLFGDRIFVHSPKGDIFDLPEGGLPLDFAYLVHSDIAKNAYSYYSFGFGCDFLFKRQWSGSHHPAHDPKRTGRPRIVHDGNGFKE